MNKTQLKPILVMLFFLFARVSFAAHAPASDDAHNHDGSHPENSAVDCGTNYMLPGEIARLGSHSFMILGLDDKDHIIAAHRSGTPPHNYQFLLRVRLDADEMAAYKTILADSKTLPAFTTIYFDKNGKQLDRTFFCLADLPKIFGDEKKAGDGFEKLFPIRASLQKNASHEGAFEIGKSVVRGKFISLNREDVELVVYRYLPSYLQQDLLRKAIKAKTNEVLPLLSHAPLYATEPVEAASKRSSYALSDALISSPNKNCPANYNLKNVPMAETIHSFLLMSELDKNTVLATHYYDQAPQNFQTALKLKLSDEEMALYRLAKVDTRVPPLLQTRVFSGSGSTAFTFCMEDIRTLVKSGKFSLKGTLFKDSSLNDYKLGQAVGTMDLAAADVTILVNRRLESLMNPQDVARDVLGTSKSTKSSEGQSDGY